MIVRRVPAVDGDAPRPASGPRRRTRSPAPTSHSDVDDETRSAMEAAMTVLLDDAAPDVPLRPRRRARRQRQGARATSSSALAADQPTSPTLVLARSPLFIDAELVDIAAAAPSSLQVAIASRPRGVERGRGGDRRGRRARRLPRRCSPTRAPRSPASASGASPSASATTPRSARRCSRAADLPPDVHQMLVRAVGDALGNMMVVKSWVPRGARRARHPRGLRSRHGRASPPRPRRRNCRRWSSTSASPASSPRRCSCARSAPATSPSSRPRWRRWRACRSSASRAWSAPGGSTALRAVYAKAGLPRARLRRVRRGARHLAAAWRRRASRATATASPCQMVDAVLARYADITDGEANELAAMLRRFAADQAREAARDYARARRAAA